ncbi:hypothetical protein CapIbe_001800 [Capra ibex]
MESWASNGLSPTGSQDEADSPTPHSTLPTVRPAWGQDNSPSPAWLLASSYDIQSAPTVCRGSSTACHWRRGPEQR